MRHSGTFTVADALLIALVVAAFYAVIRLDQYFTPNVVPFLQLAILVIVTLLLVASALRRGLAHGAHLAYTDELTGLNNRRSFTETLAGHALDFRGRGRRLALLLLDLDRFKLVNDTLGHQAGDELLKVVAQRLCNSVPAGAFVSRLGGDEFAVIASVKSAPQAMIIAEDMLRGLNQAVQLGGHEFWPNASIGIAVPGAARVQPAELLTMADVALYQAKAHDKGRAILFDSHARLPSVSKLSLESELHMALGLGQFEMRYQPIVELKSRHVVGAEALLRWNHPVHGLLTPDAFLSLAGETGIFIALGRWIVEEVSEQSCTWQQLFGSRVPVSINISAAESQSLDFVEALDRVVRDSGASVSALHLEFAEASLAPDDATTQVHMAELRRRGFKVAIDDFGVGFSSLNYLQNNRMDILKLDPAFVRNNDDDNKRAFRIVRSIIALAHSLGMTVIAEGVETEDQYQRMLLAGCDQGQGYYFARPMTPHQLTDLLVGDQVALPVDGLNERRGRHRPWSRGKSPSTPAWEQDSREKKGA